MTRTLDELMLYALDCHRSGRFGEAASIYSNVIARQPDHADALHLLGVLKIQNEQHQAGIDLIQRAIVVKPDVADFHRNLGRALALVGDASKAAGAFQRALALDPSSAEVWHLLGLAAQETGEIDEAARAFQKVLVLRPHDVDAINCLGNTLKLQEKFDEAITEYRRALQLTPNSLDVMDNLGNILRHIGRSDEAISVFRKEVSLHHGAPRGYAGLGRVLYETGELAGSAEAFRTALSIEPTFARAHLGLAQTLLAAGDFESGWEEYEWRWQEEDLDKHRPNFAQPLWDGSPLEGRRILLRSEQGYGDAIQFLRYVPQVAARGGRVVLGVPEPLARLCESIEGIEQLHVSGVSESAFDLHCPLLSLPRAMKTSLASIPNVVPYLRADPATAAGWKQRVESVAGGQTKIGLVWAGNPKHQQDHRRSISFETLFMPLAQVPGICFFSLQKEQSDSASTADQGRLNVINWTADLNDFADTAALIESLDLVISVDTAVAHLAGALGKPIWVLLPAAPDWRWMRDRPDSPWYPTMRLFRQPTLNDWSTPLKQITNELQRMQQEKR